MRQDLCIWPGQGESMELAVLSALAIAILFLVLKSRPRRERSRFGSTPLTFHQAYEPLPYRKRDYFLTRAERSFFEVLIRAVPAGLHVFAKVRLADLVWIPRRHPRRRAHLYKVLPKHIDFVLCDSAKIAPLVAIELDDSSHQRPDRIQRDAFVNEALQAAGLAFVRVPVRHSYSLKQIEQLVAAALRRPAAATTEEQPATRASQSASVPPSIVVQDVSRHIDRIGQPQDRPATASPPSTEGPLVSPRR